MAGDIKVKAAEVKAKMAKGSLAGFMDFVRTQGVVGLAVGLAIGAQSTDLVKNIVASVITPLVDLVIGKGGLNGLSWTVHAGSHVSTFTFGVLVDAMIRFMAVAFVIYFVVKGLKLDKLDKKKDEQSA